MPRLAPAPALTLAALLSVLLAAAPARAVEPLAKGISLSGPAPLRADGNPNDFRSWGNAQYVHDSQTQWVKLWVSWADLQQGYQPASLADSWQQLDTVSSSGEPYLRRLDQQVRAADDAGVHVILSLYQAYPTWSSGATGPDPYSSKGPERKIPTDLSPDGPWGWFIGHLSARYDGSINPVGPHAPGRGETDAAWRGNPDGGRVDAIEVVNEPNLLLWPQDGMVGAVATMLRSAEQLSYAYGHQAILGPATSDTPDPGASTPNVNTDWQTFDGELLDTLADFRPRVPVYWSEHNYRDVKYDVTAETSRVRQTIQLLYAKGWKGPDGDRDVWLTEGGYNLGSHVADPTYRANQASLIEHDFDEMRRLPEVRLWTHHTINDVAGNGWKSGLRDDFDPTIPGPGPVRPAWTTWLDLSGDRTGLTMVDSSGGAGAGTDGGAGGGGDTTGTGTSSGSGSTGGATDTGTSGAGGTETTPTTTTSAPASDTASTPPPAPAAPLTPVAAPLTAPTPAPAAPLPRLPAASIEVPSSSGRALAMRPGRRFTVPGARVRCPATGAACSIAVALTMRHGGRLVQLSATAWQAAAGSATAISLRLTRHAVSLLPPTRRQRVTCTLAVGDGAGHTTRASFPLVLRAVR